MKTDCVWRKCSAAITLSKALSWRKQDHSVLPLDKAKGRYDVLG